MASAVSRGGRAAVAVWTATAVLVGHVAAERQAPSIASQVAHARAAYVAGDDEAVPSLLRSVGQSLEVLNRSLGTPAAWHPAEAAFLLEIAAAVDHPSVIQRALTAGRTAVTRRPQPLGADPREDRFEILWHSAAIGIAQQHPTWSVQQSYLAAVQPRLQDAARRGVRLETRVPMALAASAAIACCYRPAVGLPFRRFDGSSRDWPIEKALALYKSAAEHPALTIEALVRTASLLESVNRVDDALKVIDGIPPHDDRGLGYVQHLIAARIHDRFNRPGEAAAAYRRALFSYPESQRANLGLAGAHLRLGQPQEARVAIDMALQDDSADRYFGDFHRLDARRVPGWLAELRELRR